jgi:type II secretory pathway pseudopilin PulG
MTNNEAPGNDALSGAIRYTVTQLHRSKGLTLQRSIGLTRRSHSSFVVRHSSFQNGVTIIEMLVVIMIIFILAALVLAASSYVQNKGARARAETEIAAMSAALESYKADNGTYPGNGDTNALDPTVDVNSSPPSSGTNKYSKGGLYLYEQLAGVTSGVRSQAPSSKSYFSFKPNMLSPKDASKDIVGISDPFGNLYGYSTSKNPVLNPTGYTTANGNNPTFDLWTTSGGSISADIPKWAKNW